MKIRFFYNLFKANFGVKIWKYAYLLMFDFHNFRIFKGLNKWQISKCPLSEDIKIVLFSKEYVVEAIKCMVKNSHFMVNTYSYTYSIIFNRRLLRRRRFYISQSPCVFLSVRSPFSKYWRFRELFSLLWLLQKTSFAGQCSWWWKFCRLEHPSRLGRLPKTPRGGWVHKMGGQQLSLKMGEGQPLSWKMVKGQSLSWKMGEWKPPSWEMGGGSTTLMKNGGRDTACTFSLFFTKYLQ